MDSPFRLRVKHLSVAGCHLEIDWPEADSVQQLRGKVTGPHSQSTSVVELTYPFRPLPNRPHQLQVFIPEPNFWDETFRLEYRAYLEIWNQQQKIRQEILLLRFTGQGVFVSSLKNVSV